MVALFHHQVGHVRRLWGSSHQTRRPGEGHGEADGQQGGPVRFHYLHQDQDTP